jgi:tetratricopeptide (TPR) repeat protein
MSKSVLAALLALFLALPAVAQVVKVTRTDGKVVQGELLGFENGRYRLRLTGGTVEEIDEKKIQDIVLISPVGDRRPSRDNGALDAARDAFDRNDLSLALQKISEAMRSLDDDRSQVAELTAKISAAYLERLLEQKDVARFSEGLRQVVPTLTPATRKDLLQKMADRLADLHKTAPDSPFTVALGDALARLADEGTLPEESRTALAELLLQRAQAESERKDYGAALTLLRGAFRLDPKRREALRGMLSETTAIRARALLEKGDAAGALAAARDAAAADPENGEIKKLIDESEFLVFRQKVDAEVGGPDLAQAIRRFLERDLRPEQRDWAEKALARATTQAKPPTSQLTQFFPVKLGRFFVYRRGDGEFTERIHTDAVVQEGDLIRVYNTVKETYRDYATSKAFLVEIEKDTVFLPTTTADREPLLKFPVQLGDSWTWQSRQREFKRTVKSLTDTVTVGSEGQTRVYNDCLVIDFTSTVDRDGAPVSLTSRSSYAPGVGLVKLEFLDAEFRKFNLELIELGQD